MSFIKVGRSVDATLNTSGSAVQTTGVELHNATEDKDVLPYFLYATKENLFKYSNPNPASVLRYTYVKIRPNNFLSFP